MNCFSSRFKKTQSGIVHIRVNELSNDIINLLHSNNFVLMFAKESLKSFLEDFGHFYTYSENNHRHNERSKGTLSLTPRSAFVALKYLCNLNK